MPIAAASIVTATESYFSVSVTEQSHLGRDGVTSLGGHPVGAFWKSEVLPDY
jgi:hypothetical protein